MQRNYSIDLNPQTIVDHAANKLVTVTPKVNVRENTDDITVWNSCNVNLWADIKLACQTIKDKSTEVEFTPATTRSVKSMAHEWAAHNVLYKFGNDNVKTKCVDVNFTNDDSTFMKIGYWFFAMVHHVIFGWS